MSVVEIGVTVGGVVAIVILAWFFFGPKKAREAEVTRQASVRFQPDGPAPRAARNPAG